MTLSTENAAPPKSSESRNSNSFVQIQIQSKSQFEFVPQDTEKSEFVDLVNFGDVSFSVETVTIVSSYGIASRLHDLVDDNVTHCNTLQHTATHCNTLQHTATPT